MNNVAAYISSLPACSDGNFGGPGGLFRASVELGFKLGQQGSGTEHQSEIGRAAAGESFAMADRNVNKLGRGRLNNAAARLSRRGPVMG